MLAVPDLAWLGFPVWVPKIAWEVVALASSVPLIGFLKRAEGEDHHDGDTDFDPFRLNAEGSGNRPLPPGVGLLCRA